MPAPSPVPNAAPTHDADVQERPPLRLLLGYRVLGLRLPERYHAWVAQDVRSRRFVTWRGGRTMLWMLALVGLAVVGYHAGRGRWPTKWSFIRAGLVVLAVALFSSREALVRRTLQWHRIDRHGRPAKKVRRMGLLRSAEAAALAVAVAVAWTAGSYVWGYSARPTGPSVAPCRDADPVLFQRILDARKDPKVEYAKTRAVHFKGGDVISAIIKPDAGQEQVKFDSWIVRPGGETIERIVLKSPDGAAPPVTTTFAEAQKLDRLTLTAVVRTLQCMGNEPVT
jgi:hypothetical protein